MISVLRVYDPPMCCSSGVCGPSVDPVLPRFAADLAWLAEQGVTVERFNLSQEPAAFVQNPIVTARIVAKGNDALPLLLADGALVSEGGYPSRQTLAILAGLSSLPLGAKLKPEAAGRSACDPKSGCC